MLLDEELLELLLEDHQRLEYGNPPKIYPEDAAALELSGEPVPSIDAAFVDAVRRRDPAPIRSTYADGLNSAAVTLAANQSAREGRPVPVPAV